MAEFSYCLTFVCQAGELEVKAALLAASLKHFVECPVEVVACLPKPESRWGYPSDNTLEFIDNLGVRISDISNEIDDDYPIGNKLGCLGVPTSADKVFFLDSDMVCMRPFRGHSRFHKPFSAVPADTSRFTRDLAVWQKVYALEGLSVPAMRMKTTITKELTPPYFNAGMIAVDSSLHFHEVWRDCCRRIDADPEIENKRPWLDQIGLPVAVAKLGLEMDLLDDSYNYPAHLKPVDAKELPYFCHYHRPDVIRQSNELRKLVIHLINTYPGLGPIISNERKWRNVHKRLGLWGRARNVIRHLT